MKAASMLPLLALIACAHAQPRPSPEVSPPASALPRSSLAAILAHRGELSLTDAQARKLATRDDALEAAQTDLRKALAQPRKTRPQGGERPPSDSSSSHPSGMGRGGRGGRSRGQATESKPQGATPEEQLDDNDSRAYLDAETAVLAEPQRESARAIAEKYREDVYDQREQAKHRGD